jgi:hypothetical protein
VNDILSLKAFAKLEEDSNARYIKVKENKKLNMSNFASTMQGASYLRGSID